MRWSLATTIASARQDQRNLRYNSLTTSGVIINSVRELIPCRICDRLPTSAYAPFLRKVGSAIAITGAAHCAAAFFLELLRAAIRAAGVIHTRSQVFRTQCCLERLTVPVGDKA